MRIQLPSGGTATVTKDVKPETVEALDEMCKAVARSVPKRIQRKRTKGWRMPEGAIYVGRPSVYGNPFAVGEIRTMKDGTKQPTTIENCLDWFTSYCKEVLFHDPNWLYPLRGKDLACWCREGAPCHADILLELANK